MLARLGEYLLYERLSRGGMADVYLAKSFGYRGANQILVLKCIRPEHSADPVFVSMFVEEAKLSALLSHQNIAQTFELGRVAGRHFIAMEHVHGRDLRVVLDRLRARGLALPEDLALHIAASTCEGLDYAHRKTGHDGNPLRLVHRDVSPPNVLIGFDGQVKLIDFGIAKVTAKTEHSRVLKGKYAYMAPEQACGREVDARSDVYSTALLLFELLTGRRMFTGRTELSVLDKVRHGEVYPPSLVLPDVTPEAEAIFLRAAALDPKARYPSAGEMRDAIVALLLRRKAPPRAGKLARLLADLFGDERREDEAKLRALRTLEMPAFVPALDEALPFATAREPAPAHDTFVEAPPAGTSVVRAAIKEPPPAFATNAAILAAAILLASLLLLLAHAAR